jgi:pimeloyl-ACP methyl ester carboxylesterase
MAAKASGPDGSNDRAGESSELIAPAREVAYSSHDGLALFVRDYGDRASPWLPVVCLPGLTRSGRDFHDLAVHLSSHRHRPRRVAVFDYRGRGRSQWDENRDNYTPLVEMADVFDGMAALGIARAVVVGTSRGGIIGMLMGVARPATVAALVLNDIGPAIEPLGLARIKSYVGRTPVPDDWADAAGIQRRLHGNQFTQWNDADWDSFARLTYRDVDGGPVGDYDPALANTFDGVDFDQPIPAMWDEFGSLKAVPVLVIRGENSDLLSEATVSRMSAVHPRVESVTVAGEGHPPLLRQPQLLNRISAFITATEGASPPPDAVAPRAAPSFSLETTSDVTPDEGGAD